MRASKLSTMLKLRGIRDHIAHGKTNLRLFLSYKVGQKINQIYNWECGNCDFSPLSEAKGRDLPT